MFKLTGKLIASVCGAAILFAGGCASDQKTDAEIEQLRTYTEQRFNDLQAHLTVISEQMDREPTATTMMSPAPSSSATPSLGTDSVVQITDIEPVVSSSLTRKQAIAALSQPVPTSKSSSTKRIVRRKTSSKSKYAKTISVKGVSTRDVQTALKNAGFNPGKVDGRVGPNTVRAIKQFQSAEKLKADGIVGRQTWSKLSAHLSRGIM